MFPAVYGGALAHPSLPAPPPHPRVVAIGNFDGVHRGHQAVLGHALELARQMGNLPLAVYTFDPAPTAVLAPERHQPRIGSLQDRLEWLGALRERAPSIQVDEVLVEHFCREFAAVPAVEFVNDLLFRQLCVKGVVVGDDFCFGANRSGTGAMLKELAEGAGKVAVEVPGVIFSDVDAEVRISSSRIRKLVGAGEVAAAARLLGRPHRLKGVVVHGEKRGRTIGFPTANLEPDALHPIELVPLNGVYAGWVVVAGERYPAVTNIGVRPTVGGQRRTIEAHILDFSGDLYGQVVAFELVARLRGEQRFEGLAELMAQIQRDVVVARQELGV